MEVERQGLTQAKAWMLMAVVPSLIGLVAHKISFHTGICDPLWQNEAEVAYREKKFLK
jgi:hypothetical protein